ncbi:MAG TPA: CHAT domain-containing protein [Nitrospira sp.]|nr:CHAT domain-containing protein [Nitrospira sp.]
MLFNRAVQTTRAFLPGYVYGRILALAILACAGNPLISLAATLPVSESPSAEQSMKEGLRLLHRGDFEQATLSWREAARLYEAEQKFSQQSSALIHLAQAYQALGQYGDALQNLESALALAEKSNDRTQLAIALASLGNVYIATGPSETARKYLDEGLRLARELNNQDVSAITLNNLGNLLTQQKKYTEALAAYKESVSLAAARNNHSLVTTALINAATASTNIKQHKEAKALLDKALDQIGPLEPSHDKASGLINIGLGYFDLRPNLPDAKDSLLLLAHKALSEAGTTAESIGDRRTSSYAWGHLGRLYEEEHRYQEALQLARRATFAAQHVNAPESLYRWEWQTGRLLRKIGTIDDAIGAYRRAVRTLQSIRPELSVSYGAPQASFRETMGPVYFELVDLLLQRGASLQDRDQVGPYLIEARETIELFKAAELRDYFRDDCVDTALSKIITLDVVAQTAVVIYPILLADRTELLLSLPSGLKRISVPVGAEALTEEVRQLRRKLEKRTTREYLPHAQKLYNWLIRPLEADLAASSIDTLVFVPDGALRTIPMTALHDGKQFLIAKYAVGITPSLNLSDPRPLKRENMKVLAVGVTEAVQGFPALPNVAAELQELQTLLGSQNLVNREFLAANLEKKLKEEQFSIVHIASHGEFGNDVENTFLLTFDDKLSLDRLNQMIGVFRFRDDPLELLTLSACDTAAGDDRAALGLAGIAIKAGARSALATLWNINDEAAVDLVLDFYRELKNPATSRAVALQRAQLKLIENPRYEHPGYWSAFLMINNWL